MSEPVDMHRGNQPGIMNLDADDGMRNDEPSPLDMNTRVVGQKLPSINSALRFASGMVRP